MARWVLHKMRMWDVRTAAGVDAFVANSQFIARRIWKTYRRPARVIYPPVDVSAFALGEKRDDFYLTASRLVPYKKIDVLIEAFADLPDRRLIVIGDGPELKRLRGKAGPNVSLLGYQDFSVLRDHMQRARAFLFAAREDFGIVPVEAQAAGTPVIAYNRGGASEVVRGLDAPRPTGVLFDEQTPGAVVEAVRQFEREQHRIRPTDCRANALRFSVEQFQREFYDFVQQQWHAFSQQIAVSSERGPARPGGRTRRRTAWVSRHVPIAGMIRC